MVKSAFLKLFLEAKKNDRFYTKPPYTKVSWLEGLYSADLPIRSCSKNKPRSFTEKEGLRHYYLKTSAVKFFQNCFRQWP